MKHARKTGFVAACLAPAALIYAVFVLWPLVQTVQISLYRSTGLSSRRTFVGTENYEWLWHSEVFWRSLGHNAFLLVVGGAAIGAISLGLAHAMQRKGPLGNVMRSVFLFPQVISLVVVAIIWQFMYNPEHGLINAGLEASGVGHLARPWLATKATALPAVTVAFVWWAIGFYVMLFSAGLQAIPAEVQEASELDGASGLRRFWTVTWPMLWSIRRIAVIYLVSNVLNVFALVFVMTKGGPDRATETMLTFLYQVGFEQSRYGRASALAVANLVLALGLSALLFIMLRHDPERSRA